MKKLACLPLVLGLVLSACGNAPGQLFGNRVSVGVAVDDSGSTETATKTVTPATETAPAKVTWTITPGNGVTFTFMTRPGSDAVYLKGYRILKKTVSTVSGTTTQENLGDVNKLNLYLTSGYSCAARTALNSCPPQASDTLPANGVPAQYTLSLEGGLGNLARATDGNVTQVTSIEFYGTSSNGQPVTIQADGIVSQGLRLGDE
ncbi:hypothetical protein [Deinococcus sp. YIM 77859]|uniref:hypothetical protein n=1 Tax=Deinococcus sp. YIM 77859 TaxID=1540221 RepID=UPI00054FA86D|nr:hypothetical protein [Deinococcus sp. YIM 77859]